MKHLYKKPEPPQTDIKLFSSMNVIFYFKIFFCVKKGTIAGVQDLLLGSLLRRSNMIWFTGISQMPQKTT